MVMRLLLKTRACNGTLSHVASALVIDLDLDSIIILAGEFVFFRLRLPMPCPPVNT
jgi:hypothetical protein